MGQVMIVSSSEKSAGLLYEMLKSDKYEQIFTVSSSSEARRSLIQNSFDLVVINTPLRDEFGHELALNIAASSAAGIILIVKAEAADEISAKVEEDGIFVIAKPISRTFFYQSLKLIEASRRRLLGLKSENLILQKKIEEIRLVDRAKCALIQYLNFSEPQAHRYIEKQAMDMRQTRREVAEQILKTYES